MTSGSFSWLLPCVQENVTDDAFDDQVMVAVVPQPARQNTVNSHFGETFRSIVGKIWCSCWLMESNSVAGPLFP